jgi:alkylation response protein AidB-like acyl-CoA dehydrogenase
VCGHCRRICIGSRYRQQQMTKRQHAAQRLRPVVSLSSTPWSKPPATVAAAQRTEIEMATATALKPSVPRQLPPPNGDFYRFADLLTAEERATVKKVRAFMESKVAPIITKYWTEDAFPFELLPAFKELNLGGLGIEGYGCAGGSQLLVGLVGMEMARGDASIATFFGVQNGLAMASIALGGSEEQKQKWLPPMARYEKIGCFGLTEPLVGSGAAGGLLTTAKREGDTWILNGQKRWIGNSPWCDVSVIWARDVADNQVKAFIVENKTTPGFSVEKIQNKIALKVVQNGQITLKDVRVPEADRLQNDSSFRDTANVLRLTRYDVAWVATGCQMGAYEHAVRYAQERQQFGKPIGSFQLVQDLLARMLGNVTASQGLVFGRRSSKPKASSLTSTRPSQRRLPPPGRARRSPGRESCMAATASSPTTTSRGSSPMPRRSTPTRAPIRCRT